MAPRVLQRNRLATLDLRLLIVVVWTPTVSDNNRGILNWSRDAGTRVLPMGMTRALLIAALGLAMNCSFVIL